MSQSPLEPESGPPAVIQLCETFRTSSCQKAHRRIGVRFFYVGFRRGGFGGLWNAKTADPLGIGGFLGVWM
jgi:hypothetical protein